MFQKKITTLQKQGEMIAGVVFEPCRDILYTAEKGKGSFANGKPMSVSQTRELDQALIAASFSPKVGRDSDEIKRFVEILCRCQALRRLGSAAINLCLVGTGQLDAYWATSLKIWDVAAGYLIATEAGATCADLDGSPFTLKTKKFSISSTKELNNELQTALRASLQ